MSSCITSYLCPVGNMHRAVCVFMHSSFSSLHCIPLNILQLISHLPLNGHMASGQYLAMVNETAVNIHVCMYVFRWQKLLFPLGINPGMELLGHSN